MVALIVGQCDDDGIFGFADKLFNRMGPQASAGLWAWRVSAQ